MQNDKKIGVLLVNLGSPDAPDKKSVRKYLKQFLSDARVIEVPRLIWWFILNLIILNIRPKKSAKAYQKIWDYETNSSPLKKFTKLQSKAIKNELSKDNNYKSVEVSWAMRYGNPSISNQISQLTKKGINHLLILPLYPQYSATTTATVCDEVFKTLLKLRAQPAIRIIPPFYNHTDYIDALTNNIKNNLNKLDFTPELLLLSNHGLPEDYVNKGDPYQSHCLETSKLLSEHKILQQFEIKTSFQSRFGKQKWIEPYTDETLTTLPKEGKTNLAVAMPSFISDCLETLEEIAIEGKETFIENGGKNFAALPCLNDSDEAISFLTSLIKKELAGWI